MTDAGQTFGVQTARHYHADWELNAMSGMGMNRNWNGNRPEVNFRRFYPRLLQSDATINADEAEWHPQVAGDRTGNQRLFHALCMRAKNGAGKVWQKNSKRDTRR